MAKFFSPDNEVAWARVLQTYTILVEHAIRRETTLYKTLADKLGFFPAGIGYYLDPVAQYCRDAGLPDLTVLTVAALTGEPAPGPEATTYLVRESVYKWKWVSAGSKRPTLAKLRAMENGGDSSSSNEEALS